MTESGLGSGAKTQPPTVGVGTVGKLNLTEPFKDRYYTWNFYSSPLEITIMRWLRHFNRFEVQHAPDFVIFNRKI